MCSDVNVELVWKILLQGSDKHLLLCFNVWNNICCSISISAMAKNTCSPLGCHFLLSDRKKTKESQRRPLKLHKEGLDGELQSNVVPWTQYKTDFSLL